MANWQSKKVISFWLYSCFYITMSTVLKLEAPWPQVKELLKEANSNLTDEDLYYTPGSEDALLQRLAKKMDRSTEHIKGWIESVSSNKGKAS